MEQSKIIDTLETYQHPLTPTAVLRNEEYTINLSSDEDLGDEAL